MSALPFLNAALMRQIAPAHFEPATDVAPRFKGLVVDNSHVVPMFADSDDLERYLKNLPTDGSAKTITAAEAMAFERALNRIAATKAGDQQS